jgi:transcriptional regulator GlxA family with amidase domain
MPRIGIYVSPDFQMMNLAVMSVFELANRILKRSAYSFEYVSECGGPISASIGCCIHTERLDDQVFDTLFIAASTYPQNLSQTTIDSLRKQKMTSRRIAAPCTGAFVLAESGLLNGKKATTHWFFANQFRDTYPQVNLESDRIYVSDESLWTSAGMSAAIDLAIAMIDEDFGSEVSKEVAKKMVVYNWRSGGQSQFSSLIDMQPKSDRIHRTLDYARKNLKHELSVEELAEVANLSPRQFSRMFTKETGYPPAKAVEKIRIEIARLMLEDSTHSLDVVAFESGFGDRERMRKAFIRTLGHAPQYLRQKLSA